MYAGVFVHGHIFIMVKMWAFINRVQIYMYLFLSRSKKPTIFARGLCSRAFLFEKNKREKRYRMDKLYIVMPAYNEQDTIEDVVCGWYKVLDFAECRSKLVIADSGSTDETHNILLKLCEKMPNLIILNDTNKYHGPKLIALYKKAILEEADYIFQTDSDGQTNPNEFIEFWKDRINYDAIFGYRKNRKDGLLRKLVEKIVCILLKIFFEVKIKDANAPFRLMKSKVLRKYIYRFNNDFNIPNIMLTTFFVYYKEKVCFKEISFKPRQGGVNSINIKKILIIGLNAIKDFRKFKEEM